jgi:undecaprenyl-diphosphatase
MNTLIELLKALLFGIVEGITEWLPISSTGHLILLDELVKLKVSDEFWSMFEVVIQLGAILAVIVLFFHRLNPFSASKSPEQKKETWILWLKVILSILPSGVIGILLDDWMDEHLHTAVVVAAALIVYGVAFLFLEKMRPQSGASIDEAGKISYRTAFFIGCFQVLALIPGTSRSGSTILGAMLLGLSRSAAAEFSFFMAIPTMVGASGIKILKFAVSGTAISGTEWGVLAVGFVSAFLVSLAAIKFLMDFVKKHSFSAFGWYRIALGLLVLAWFFLIR